MMSSASKKHNTSVDKGEVLCNAEIDPLLEAKALDLENGLSQILELVRVCPALIYQSVDHRSVEGNLWIVWLLSHQWLKGLLTLR